MEKKLLKSLLKYGLILAAILLIVFVVIFWDKMVFALKYDVEFDEKLDGYVLIDIAIHHGEKLELPKYTASGESIVGAGNLFSRKHFFVDYSSIEYLVIPDGYKTLETACTKKPIQFGKLISLKKIEIGAGLESGIYGGVFNQNSQLSVIEIDDNNQKYYSTGNCIIERESGTLIAGCGSSVIPEGVKTIGQAAFVNSNIKSVVIPKSVVKICTSAFYECTELEYLYIPINVSVLEKKAIYSCSKLTVYCESSLIPDGWEEDCFESVITVVFASTAK